MLRLLELVNIAILVFFATPFSSGGGDAPIFLSDALKPLLTLESFSLAVYSLSCSLELPKFDLADNS